MRLYPKLVPFPVTNQNPGLLLLYERVGLLFHSNLTKQVAHVSVVSICRTPREAVQFYGSRGRTAFVEDSLMHTFMYIVAAQGSYVNH